VSSVVMVVKADGRREPFDRGKLLRSARMMGAGAEAAEQAVREVERQIYDGISTRELSRLLHRALRRLPSLARYGIVLREALARVNPYPDFEFFVRGLLEREGYNVERGGVVPGRCSEHEIDGVLIRGGETLVLEVKHHRRFHTHTGLDVVRIARATLEDLQEGFGRGVTPRRFTGTLVATNTKLSPLAEKYARCRGILFMGWSTPPGGGMNDLVLRHHFYPVTFLRGLKPAEHRQFSEAQIYTLQDLLSRPQKRVAEETGISLRRLSILCERARKAVEFRPPASG